MGDLEKLKDLNKKSAIFFSIPDRIPNDPTRSFKNLLFVLNTLCRTAARKGGVNPIYIHNLSEKFAIMIEKAPNLPFLKKLSEIIPIEYCELVQSHSTSGYSPIVRQAIDYINLNLESSLALTEIADTIPSNPSHLSRKFKAETGHTITEYINQQRVKEAKLLLEQKDMSITDVAFIVGFNDLNYFTRVFKKMTQITPSQYAKEASN
jgi:AraC-like DNA-binding protein